MSQEVEETLKRIQQHKGVVGVVVVNNEGKQINLKLLELPDFLFWAHFEILVLYFIEQQDIFLQFKLFSLRLIDQTKNIDIITKEFL